MNDETQLLTRYRRLRRLGMAVNQTLVSRLSKDVLEEGARKLGILRKGVMVFDSEDETSVLMDFCIHDVRRHGRTAAEQFLAESPYPPGSDEAVYLESLKDAYYSVFAVESRQPGVHVGLRDLVSGASCQIVDTGLSRTAETGFVLASRLIAPDNIPMTGGAALPMGMLPPQGQSNALTELVALVKSTMGRARTPEERSEVIATLIRNCLQVGMSSHITYEEPGAAPRSLPPSATPPSHPSRPPAPFDRYAPCPCGSGRKYKFCCGARR
jgi:hypothetical protein